MKSFVEWAGEVRPGNSIEAEALGLLTDLRGSDAAAAISFRGVYVEIVSRQPSPPDRTVPTISNELHNALRLLHRRYLAECADQMRIAIVPLAESTFLWETELWCGYSHAGLHDDKDVAFCETVEQVSLATERVVVLDVKDVSVEQAYLRLCELAAEAVSCGRTLEVRRFGD